MKKSYKMQQIILHPFFDIFMGATFQLHLNTYTLSFSEEKKMCTVLGKPVQCPFFLASGPEIMAFGAPSPTANHSYCH